MADLFVSYKSEDRARVALLVAALEADGFDLWWDAHLGGGTAWREAIERELNAARCVLVVWSARSVGPDGSFVRDEASRALRRGVYLPIRIDAIDPPLGFGETQALPLIGWTGDRRDPRYLAIRAAAQALMAGALPPPRMTAPVRRGVDRRLVIGGGAVVAAIAGAGGWWALHRSASAASDSVAVLPFANLSGDPAQAYFSDGIAEELRSALARIVRLKVAARTSSEIMRDVDAPTAAAKLGVAHIVTGSVRRAGDTIRVSAQLIDGISGLTRWSDSYDRAAGDVLAIETGIAENVANALNIALGRAEKALLSAGGTTNAIAHDAYLRGAASEAAQKPYDALPEYAAAVAADPNYALALAGHASITCWIAIEFTSRPESALVQAAAEARRAVALAPGLGRPYGVLGFILFTQLDFRGATTAFDTAIRLAPDDSFLLGRYSIYLNGIGRSADALRLIDRAQRLDPLRANNLLLRGWSLYSAGRFVEAVAVLQHAVARLPDDIEGQSFLSLALIAARRPADGLAIALTLKPGIGFREVAEAIARFQLGDRAGSDRALEQLKAIDNDSYEVAEVHAQRGEIEPAFAALTAAVANREAGIAQVKGDPLLRPLHSDPRFAALARKIGYL